MVDPVSALYILGSWAFWGTYPVPFKNPAAMKANIDPFTFQCYKTLIMFITAWITLAWNDFTFTYWGIAGAAIWVPSGLLFITAVKLAGVALTTPIANGFQVIVSFCWGSLYFGEHVSHWGLAILALFIMVIGMCGISFSVNYEKIHAARMKAKKSVSVRSEEPDESSPLVVDMNKLKNEDCEQQNQQPYQQNQNQQYQPLTQPQQQAQPNSKLKDFGGIFVAIVVGIMGGSINFPLKNAPGDAHGIQYLISFGIGSMIVTAGLTLVYIIIRLVTKRGMPVVNLRVSALPGTAAGLLYAAGNFCQIYATLQYGQTVGFPLVMCSMMVAGCWGVFYYSEAPRLSMKILFIFSCATLLGGVTLLSKFG